MLADVNLKRTREDNAVRMIIFFIGMLATYQYLKSKEEDLQKLSKKLDEQSKELEVNRKTYTQAAEHLVNIDAAYSVASDRLAYSEKYVDQLCREKEDTTKQEDCFSFFKKELEKFELTHYKSASKLLDIGRANA